MNKQVHQPDDKWLEALRHKVDEAHVPPPADGWTRLESALDAPKKGVVFWPWLIPAAVAAMAILVFLWQGGGTPQDTELLVDGTEVVLVDTIPADTVQVMTTTQNLAVVTESSSAKSHTKQKSKSRVRVTKTASVVTTDSKPVHKEHVVLAVSTQDIENKDKDKEKGRSTENTSPKDNPEDTGKVATTTTRTRRRYTNIPFGTNVKKKHKRKYTMSLLAASGMSTEYATTDADCCAAFGPMDFTSGEGKIYEHRDNDLLYRAIPEYDYEHELPVKFGLGVTISFTERWALETGLTYTRLRSQLTDVRDSEEITQTIHYLGVPLRLNYTWLLRPRYKWYTAFGVTIERAVDANRGGDDLDVNGIQCGLEGAVGVQYMLTRRLGLFGEIGVSHYYDDDSKIETYRDEHKTSVLLNAGLRFEF